MRFNRAFVIISGFLFLLCAPHPTYSQGADLENAIALNQQVVRLYRQGRYLEAIPIAERVLAISEKALGPEHHGTSQCLNNLAMLYSSMGAYAKAEPLLKRALAISEKALGPEHPGTGASLNSLAMLYSSMGAYAKAEPLFMRALAISEKALGPEHSDTGLSLNNLAGLYDSMGDYAKAEPLFKRALAIREKVLGPEHPDTGQSLDNLAALYSSMGDYAKAEPLYKRALAIREKALGPEHPDTGTNLNTLALLYHSMGDYAKAEPLYKRALAIREKSLGAEHPYTGASLNNLAGLYKSMGDYAKTEPLYKRALAISEKALGPEHPSTGQRLNNLAGLYYSMGDYAKAEPLFKRALAISEKALGPEHPDTGTNLNNLAMLYGSMGDYAKAESLYKRALAIYEKVLGAEHPLSGTSLNNLAALYAAQGDFHKASALHFRSLKIDKKLIDQVIGFASEDRQARFLATLHPSLEAALSLAAFHLKDDPSCRKQALDLWLRRKGVLLEAQRRFQEALVYSDDPEAVTTFQELARVRSRLSQLSFAGPGKEGPEAYREKMRTMEAEKQELEAKLSALSHAYAVQQKIQRADSAKVAQVLPVNTALLEFVRINTFNFKARGKENKWLPARYLAFVLPAGKGDNVALIDLGDAGRIDGAIALFKKQIAVPKDQSAPASLETSRKIHALVFAPLKQALGDVNEVFISPDGNLNLIPFEVLQGPDGRFLIEDYTFNYLAAGRDITGFGQIEEKGGKAILIGDPDFDLDPVEKSATLRKLSLAEASLGETTHRSAEMRGLYFKRLPGTREEVEGIQNLLGEKAERYTGKAALEEVLRQQGAPRILHLATHGFFLKDQDLSALGEDDGSRTLKLVKFLDHRVKGQKLENPLLRSGIALAGANCALKSGETNKSDGLVTAEKILGLRLRGTEMVVLSACETGLGEVKAGEGVYGLRRAFVQAGTKGLVMSLWSVPDVETKELMIAFYQNILSGKMNRVQALRQAALRQMELAKSRYGSANPYYWGAFVYLGEPWTTEKIRESRGSNAVASRKTAR